MGGRVLLRTLAISMVCGFAGLAVVHCGQATPSRGATASSPESLAGAPVAAFVVYGWRKQPASRAQNVTFTVVVPVAQSVTAPALAEGLWVLDSTRIVHAEVHHWPPGLPECACGASSSASCAVDPGLSRLRITRQGLAPGSAPERGRDDLATAFRNCSCVHQSEPDPDEPHPCLRDCDEQKDDWPSSLVGGRLYLEGYEGETCRVGGGYQTPTAEVIDLAPDRPELTPTGDWSCVPHPGEGSHAGPGQECRPGVAGCEGCDARGEGHVLRLESGRLVEWKFSTGMWDGAASVREAPLTATNCPSPFDPCGAPDRFPSRLRWSSFWVATSGQAALGETHGELAVLLPDEHTSVVRAHLPGRTEVIGVRYHDDVRRLTRAMAEGVEAPARVPSAQVAERRCARDRECAAGQLCSEGTCRARCRDDQQCLDRGECGSFCAEDGRCIPTNERGGAGCDRVHVCDVGHCEDHRCADRGCADERECDPGQICDANGHCRMACASDEACQEPLGYGCEPEQTYFCGTGGACVPVGDESCDEAHACPSGLVCLAYQCQAPEDVSAEAGCTVAAGNGAAWGEACLRSFRAGSQDQARAACAMALHLARTPAVRGSVLYNLGRIAEADHERERARRLYRLSLASRPGNATVVERLRSLSPGPR